MVSNTTALEPVIAHAPNAKVNEAGINSPFVSDATALPGASYTYDTLDGVLRRTGAGDVEQAFLTLASKEVLA